MPLAACSTAGPPDPDCSGNGPLRPPGGGRGSSRRRTTGWRFPGRRSRRRPQARRTASGSPPNTGPGPTNVRAYGFEESRDLRLMTRKLLGRRGLPIRAAPTHAHRHGPIGAGRRRDEEGTRAWTQASGRYSPRSIDTSGRRARVTRAKFPLRGDPASRSTRNWDYDDFKGQRPRRRLGGRCARRCSAKPFHGACCRQTATSTRHFPTSPQSSRRASRVAEGRCA